MAGHFDWLLEIAANAKAKAFFLIMTVAVIATLHGFRSMSMASFYLRDFIEAINITYSLRNKMHIITEHGKTIAQKMSYYRGYQGKCIEDKRERTLLKIRHVLVPQMFKAVLKETVRPYEEIIP